MRRLLPRYRRRHRARWHPEFVAFLDSREWDAAIATTVDDDARFAIGSLATASGSFERFVFPPVAPRRGDGRHRQPRTGLAGAAALNVSRSTVA
jgi:hypothetical protein